MRYRLLLWVARLMGLTQAMVSYKEITSAAHLDFATYREVFAGRRREVRCIVLATDPLVAVEAMHTIADACEVDGATRDRWTVQ